MAKKKYQTGGLDENNLPEGTNLSTSTLNTVDQGGTGLSVSESLDNLSGFRNPRNSSSIGSTSAQVAQTADIAQDPNTFKSGLESSGYLDPESNPELYKTIYQGDRKNAWNTLMNEMRTMRKSEVEDDLRDVRIKLAEYENAKDRADGFYAKGLVSKTDHSKILSQIEEGFLRGGEDKPDLVAQLIDGVMGGLSQSLTSEDYLRAVTKATEEGLLTKPAKDKLPTSLSGDTDTYQSLLEQKENIKKDLEYREEEIKSGGFGSLGAGVLGRGDKWYQQGIPTPFYGGGDVGEDYHIRSKIEKNRGATALSSIPIFSNMAGLSEKWTGDEYFQYKAAEDAAGSISTFEGQIASILGPALVKTIETQTTNKLLNGVKNPYVRGTSALLQFGAIVAGNMWSRNLETKMEAGDAYWQKVDKLQQALKQQHKEAGIDRELTKAEKNNIAIIANVGIDKLKQNNMTLGGSDVIQFALTFMKLPGLAKTFTGNTFRNIAAKELTSRLGSRGLIQAGKFAAGVGLSRELEGMEEGLQLKWSNDYLGGYGQERSGSFLNNYWDATKNVATDAVDYSLNMAGVRKSDPDFYESLAFRSAVQSGRDMATMMTGGGRAVSNWGGAKSFAELNNAMSLLGEGGDQINRKRLLGDKKEILYNYFKNGKSGDLYDAIYRMGRKLGTSQTSLLSRQESIDIINEIQQAEKIYNDVFDSKSPLSISALGINYDIGSAGGASSYSEGDKKKVFTNALSTIENNKRRKELSALQESYREGKLESLDLFTTALTPEEQAEYDAILESKVVGGARKKELEAKLSAGEASLEQKERVKEKMEEKSYSATPYDLELIENSKDTERAKKENEEIATEKKTWIGDPNTNEGALWDISAVEQVMELRKEYKALMEKGDLTASEKATLDDLFLEENKIRYEQNFEYNALQRGRLGNETKRAALIHLLGGVIQHIEKYGSKGLNKILPSILDNNTKLDPQTITDLGTLAQEILDERGDVVKTIKQLKAQRESLLTKPFDAVTLTQDQHKPLTAEEKETLLKLRAFEEAGTLDENQKSTLEKYVVRAQEGVAIEALNKEISEQEALQASLTETADMAEKFVSRVTSSPDAFLLNDNDFSELNDEAILKEAALTATEGVDYINDQLKNIPDFADVENVQRIHDQIEERLGIFKRRIVEAPDSKKDYFIDIANELGVALRDIKPVLAIVKANAANRTQDQYNVEERMFKDALSSLGLNLDFQLDEGSVFENVGKIVVESVGQPALNILKNSLELNSDLVGVTLVMQGLLKEALSDQSKVKTKLKTELRKISKEQSKAFIKNVNDNIGKDKVSTGLYSDNPKANLKGLLHQISTINKDRDMDNRDSALWKYVDHLSPHKLLEDIIAENREGLEVSSETIAELLMHHLFHLQAEKQLNIVNSDLNVTDQLENEKFVLQNKTIEFIPTKQQLQSIRELSVFLRSDIKNSETLTLGGSSAFLQGAAGTGKSKIVLPWAMQTAGIPDRNIFAFGHNPSSSATINASLGFIKKEGNANTVENFLEIDDVIAEELEVIVIDEAPGLDDQQYFAIEKQVRHINALKHAAKKPALKVILLGDEAQLINDNVGVSPVMNNAYPEIHTLITPVTSIYRSDNPAISNFQDVFRRRLEDLSKTELTVKLNKANPWIPGASGVYGVSGDFKEKLILKFQNPAENNQTRVIITNLNRVGEYEALIKANKLQDVKVLSFIDAQGETIDEVYMDIHREGMSVEKHNKAIYTAVSRATNLIVTTNLNIKNTLDPQLDIVQQGLSAEIQARKEEFQTEVLENSKLLKELVSFLIEILSMKVFLLRKKH